MAQRPEFIPLLRKGKKTKAPTATLVTRPGRLMATYSVAKKEDEKEGKRERKKKKTSTQKTKPKS